MENQDFINYKTNPDEIYFKLVRPRLVLNETSYIDNTIKLFNRGKREKIDVENFEIDAGIKMSELEEVMRFKMEDGNDSLDIESMRKVGLLYKTYYHRGKEFLEERKFQELIRDFQFSL